MSEKTKKRLAVMAPGGRQSKRVRSIPPAQVVPEPENRDWSYAYDGGLDEDEAEGNPIPEDNPISEGWFLCYPQDCCTNVCILVQ